jgi:two-component system OmpR family response regulator
MAHILLLEDQPKIWSNIQKYLDSHQVDRCQTIASAYTLLENRVYDIAILDRMLPDGNAMDLCLWIKTHRDTLVILQTARSQIEDKETWFGHGADDYLTKPFDLRELELRIENLLKRKKESDIWMYKDVSVDLASHQVTRAWQSINLSTTEFRLIALLIKAGGRVVSRTDLLDEIRGSDALRWDDNKLDVYISMLRKKLGKDCIITEKWFGYRIGG